MEKTPKMKLEAGDDITCPSCEMVLMTCVKVPRPGASDYIDHFTYKGWRGGKGANTHCSCGAPWTMNDGHAITALHVDKKGWVL